MNILNSQSDLLVEMEKLKNYLKEKGVTNFHVTPNPEYKFNTEKDVEEQKTELVKSINSLFEAIDNNTNLMYRLDFDSYKPKNIDDFLKAR